MQLRNFALPAAFAGIAAAAFVTLNFMGSNPGDANQGEANQGEPGIAALTDALTEAGVGSDSEISTGSQGLSQEAVATLSAQNTGEEPQSDGETSTDGATSDASVADAPVIDASTNETSPVPDAAQPSAQPELQPDPQPEPEATDVQVTVLQPADAGVDNNETTAQPVTPQASETVGEDQTTDTQVTVFMPDGTTTVAEAGEEVLSMTANETAPVTETSDGQATAAALDTGTETAAGASDAPALAQEDTSLSTQEIDPALPLDPAQPEGEPLGLIVELTDLPAEEQPRFGRTKLENNGTIYVIQGSGVPGTPLELLANDRVIAKTDVDPGGAWSLYESAALPAGLHVLTLRTSLSDGRIGLSEDRVVVYVDPQSDNLEAELAVLQGQGGRLTMLSGPRFVTDLIPQALAYTDTGLRITGKAPAGSEVVFILPGESVSDAPSTLIGADGVWDLALDGGAGQTGTLIQRNPVSGAEVARTELRLPEQPDLLDRSVQEAGEGRALKIQGATYYFF